MSKQTIPSNFQVACPICQQGHRCVTWKQAVTIKLSSSKYIGIDPNKHCCIDHGKQRFHKCWRCWFDKGDETVFTVRLNNDSPFPIIEVIQGMKIPATVLEGKSTKSGLSFIRAAQLTPPPAMGTNIEFTIGGDVEVGGSEEAPLYSVPVAYVYNGQKTQGQYSLNKTALRALAVKLGDETTAWTGARFTSFVNLVRNPRTGAQGPGFTVVVDSVRSPKAK